MLLMVTVVVALNECCNIVINPSQKGLTLNKIPFTLFKRPFMNFRGFYISRELEPERHKSQIFS